MAGKKNLCAMIPAELHARIMAEKEEMKLGTLAEYVERIFAEHFEGGNDMQTERTLAVKISAELFDRLKEYLEKNHLKQKDFITQLIQQALDNAEESVSYTHLIWISRSMIYSRGLSDPEIGRGLFANVLVFQYFLCVVHK